MTERELLRQLVDALDKELPHNMKHIAAGQRFNARVALAQPEQEPVAVVSGYYGGQCVILPTNPTRIFNSGTALYTTPPQRKPLDEREREWIVATCPTPRHIIKAVEAAHGIKE